MKEKTVDLALDAAHNHVTSAGAWISKDALREAVAAFLTALLGDANWFERQLIRWIRGRVTREKES